MNFISSEGPESGTEDQLNAERLKDFVKSNLKEVEIKDEHKVLTFVINNPTYNQ